MRRLLRFLALSAVPAAAVVCLVAVPAPARPPAGLARLIDEVVTGPDYTHASWGILVVDADGNPVYARNPDQMLAPASVTKLFTCAAALLALGADHTFVTDVFRRGLLLNGTLRGDLILVASGDPIMGGRTGPDGKTVWKNSDHTYAGSGLAEAYLTDADPLAGLNDIARQVKASGVNAVEGEVMIDDRLFARARSSGSGPDVVSPVTVNDNVVDVIVTPGAKAGDPATVKTRPETAFFQVDAQVSTADEKAKAQVEVLAVGPNHLAVRGRVPAAGKAVVAIHPVAEPALFARALLVEALRRNGVRCEAAVIRPGLPTLPPRGDYATLTKAATLKSAPLSDLTTVTLKVSHNLYASTLPCLVAVGDGRTTAADGLRRGRRLLTDLGVDAGAFSFGGGAGGAEADCVSARATVQLLRGMAARPEWAAYRAGLPVLGVDGTLAAVVGRDSPARGKVFAKTGTLYWTDVANDRWLLRSKALAGTMITKGGATLYFAMFVNNVPVSRETGSAREGRVLGRLCEIIHDNGP
ncbi:D-alanyl-D-alanine carboxypeptidase/D-alanyl-D-alanine endopeptidase [Urbifossiella limnaea]|uniref:D-alanyl-D-alanine carboxypeptidase n=1 Tax=Urbifossiella limnaea TaxID=2528023 RepID=A0A517XTF3_9BACT|nr:D-alanyl-D-alanine carboxypeptidase/D-alanyl-D-alanine-endopeptidase [Urbifossiella limnaea]QDU20767.1 D-alanyl-D-alanine carboxypeptidase precursor [Urbifossiella limnaea]